jgi:hypothetical protein
MCPGDLEIWLNHFEHHARHTRSAPQGVDDDLAPEERRLIARSIATFRPGKQSDGLMLATRRFVQAEPALGRIVELLNVEQHRHEALLRAFLQDHRMVPGNGQNRIARAWHLAHLELHLRRLVNAALIGTVYYRALESVTGNHRLKHLCRTLVADELVHIGFGSQLLSELQSNRSAAARILARLARRALFASSAGIVWWTQRLLLQRAGHGAWSFLRACQDQYDFYLEPTRLPPGSVEGPSEAGERPRSARPNQGAAATNRMRVISAGTPNRFGGPQ